MINIIRIKGASCYAYHGAMKEEQHIGGKFEADIDIYTDFSKAAENDDLKLTVNYDEVYKFVNKIINGKKYYLIETLVTVIADSIIEHFEGIEKVAVRLRKSAVPVGGLIDYVEAEVIKENGE